MITTPTAPPAGLASRPGAPGPAPTSAPPIDHVWVGRGLTLAHRALDIVTTADPDAAAELGASTGKVIAETAILLRALPREHRGPQWRALADRVAALARDPRTLLALALHASASFELAVPYLVLREHSRSEAIDALLRACFEASAAQGRELLPHRGLERLWLLGMLDGDPTIDPADLAGTVLAHELDVLHGTRDDHYAFTHALFYATDFGRCPGAVPTTLVPGLVAQARSALAGALDDDDYDLAGELLLTWPLLGVPAGPVEATALRVLAEVAEQVGTLPSLTLALPQPEGAAVAAADAAVLSTYHTGFVFTVLAALAGRVPWAAPEASRREPLDGGAGAGTTLDWPDDGRRPGWLAVPAATFAMGALPLEARLRRLARAGRASDLAQLLCRRGVPSTPATRQALHLLQRLSLL